MEKNYNYFIGLALDEAKISLASGNLPVGSVIVKNGEIIGKGRNVVISQMDPTAHAEMTAIRDACGKLKTADLTDCVCYTTVEPCPMCTWALLESGIRTVVLGARFSDLNKKRTGNYSIEKLLDMTGREMQIIMGIRVDECKTLRDSWNK